MKYFIPILFLLTSCNTITTRDHPIDKEKQETLLLSESPVLTINLVNISILTFILSLLIFFIWYVGWKRTQKSVEDDS
jgi:hypothetical protein